MDEYIKQWDAYNEQRVWHSEGLRPVYGHRVQYHLPPATRPNPILLREQLLSSGGLRAAVDRLCASGRFGAAELLLRCAGTPAWATKVGI